MSVNSSDHDQIAAIREWWACFQLSKRRTVGILGLQIANCISEVHDPMFRKPYMLTKIRQLILSTLR